MELANVAYTAISRYFTRLSQTGYVPYYEVNKMLALFIIKDIVDKFILTEEQFRQINDALTCLYGSSCLLPYPDYIIEHRALNVMRNYINCLRITDEDLLRSAEIRKLRRIE